jgi:hypothetical protein
MPAKGAWQSGACSHKGQKGHVVANFCVMRMSKPKNCGKDPARVFLDVFSLPEHESGVHFPRKNLDLPLENLLFFAV